MIKRKKRQKQVVVSLGRHKTAKDFAEVAGKYKEFKGTYITEYTSFSKNEAKEIEQAFTQGVLPRAKGFAKAELQFTKAVKKKGGKIKVLNYPSSLAQRKALRKAYTEMNALNKQVDTELKKKRFDKAFKAFKKNIFKFSKVSSRADKNIASRILALKEKDILLRYGSFHTGIYHELKKAGVDVEREMAMPHFFDMQSIAFRKAYFKKPLGDIDIWRALVLRSRRFPLPRMPSASIKSLVGNILLSNVRTAAEAKKVLKNPKKEISQLLTKANFPVQKYYEEKNYHARNKILLKWLSKKTTIPINTLQKL